ncbi:MAG: cytochrome c [Gammaproteobacteria bacterium]|nr:cytochrome c [Gammaproteobacteria bacterium]
MILARTLAVALALGVLGASSRAAEAPSTEAGQAIYRRGILPSGAPLEGRRQVGGLGLKGADAACINCHRRSGLGTREGNLSIPPVTGQYLFHTREATMQEPVLHYVEGMHGNRDPYTDVTLARAIREGVDSGGRALSTLMPRFALNDADMAALINYLKSLGAGRQPGVSDTLLQFATVITPDADPARRQGMLDVLNQFVTDKNAFPFGPSPQMRTSGKTMYSKSMFTARRHWQLHVWQLTGPPAGWGKQLRAFYAREPVMALLSGAGGPEWGPVHDFCEHEQVPCLFPNVEVPVVAAGDFYSLYFSRGVLLEAALIARRIAASFNGKPGAVVEQIYRAGDSGEAGARALAAALRSSGIEARSQVLPPGAPGSAVSNALHEAMHAEVGALVLWLRPADLAALGEAPKALPPVYLSGLLGGLEAAPLPSSWRPQALMAYPFDLPDRRVVRVDYPLGWFSFRHIPVVAEQVQADTYLACGILAETLNHMADVTDRDYLVELMQEILEHRIMTGYYPRLTLGTGQTLASKGGYFVRFADPSGVRLVADGDWTVP